jgi:pimeloyl-ACP methyl ester carboxylesterase
MMSLLLKTGLVILLVYFVYLGFIYFIQRTFIYPGRTISSREYNVDWIKPEQVHWLETDYGKTETWYIQTDTTGNSTNRPVVIMAHGNYELIDFCQPEVQGFLQLGADFLLVEFPGFGRSKGETTQKSITAAFVAAYDWLIEQQGKKEDQIIGYGRSLGGGAICALANERSLKGLILQSTFTSIRSFAGRFLAPSFLVKDKFDNEAVLRAYKKPVLIFHGRQDFVIPYTHGEQLGKTALRGTFIGYDCDHNNCPPDWVVHWKTIGNFINELNSGPSNTTSKIN